MAEKIVQLRTPYSGYLHREVPREDEEITRVGPGTPGGEYHRRFWQPVGLSAELEDVPRRIKILGEDLVLFRDRSGRVGLLELHCAHRGTSLEFGLVSDRGITCCYHGWQYDIDGKILATPGEPPDSTLKDRLHHGAYLTHEFAGMVFAYMGPQEKKPPFPRYDTFELPGYRLEPGSCYVVPCNWLQIKDNSMDPVHTAFLHTRVSTAHFTEAYREVGSLDWAETPVGLVYIHTRRVGDNVWVHSNDFLPPNIHQVPPTWENGKQAKNFQRSVLTHWSVPIDDTHSMNITFRRVYEGLTEEERKEMKRQYSGKSWMGFGQSADRTYEERQRVPGDYDAQVSQRPIAVHALEHLGATDRGITMLRKMVREGIRAVQRGEDPRNLVREEGKCQLTYSGDTILRIPQTGTQEEDLLLLRKTGRRVVDNLLSKHPDQALAAAE